MTDINERDNENDKEIKFLEKGSPCSGEMDSCMRVKGEGDYILYLSLYSYGTSEIKSTTSDQNKYLGKILNNYKLLI